MTIVARNSIDIKEFIALLIDSFIDSVKCFQSKINNVIKLSFYFLAF